MLRRLLAIAVAVALLPAVLAGCQGKVDVQTGERVTCRFGDTIKNTVHTVKVPASEAHLYSVKSTFGVCDRHAKLAALYDKAQEAITAGNLKSAETLLQRVVTSDPDFAQASTQLAQIKQRRTPTPDTTVERIVAGSTGGGGSTGAGSTGGSTGGGSGGTKPPAADTPVGPTLTLAAWAPAALDGFNTGTTAADPLALTREYIPVSGGQLEAVVISVEQFASGKMASSGLAEQMRHYDKNRTSEKVAGRASTYGTDGRQFAALGFVNGALLVIVEGHTKSGIEPNALRDELVAVANKLPVK